MSAGEFALVVGAVLCAIAFAALAVTLVRVRDTQEALQQRLDELAAATNDLDRTVGAARAELDRFDELLGSAESISKALGRTGSAGSRLAYSAPAIKAAGLATGAGRAAKRLRSGS